MRGRDTEPSGPGKSYTTIPANLRGKPGKPEYPDTTATPGSAAARISLGLSSPGTKVFRKGLPTATTSPYPYGNWAGIPGRMEDHRRGGWGLFYTPIEQTRERAAVSG